MSRANAHPRHAVSSSSEDLLSRIERTVTAHRLFQSSDRMIVAVSGGIDSVVLLHLLTALRSRWKLTLHIAHLDHGLRDGSRDDADFVRGLGEQWRVPVTTARIEVKRRCEQEGWSLEDGARRLRYQFLLEVARKQSASRIVVAHTADDQAETVLMRLMRGTGLAGLGAMPMTRTFEELELVRPLLDVWRRDIVAYREVMSLPYREDDTNANTHFLRNRVRHELLPLLERTYNPNIKQVLTNLAEQSRWDYDYLCAAARRQWKRIAKPGSGAGMHGADRVRAGTRALGGKKAGAPKTDEVRIATAGFLRQPKALQRQLVRQAMESVRAHVGQFEFRHWLEVERLFLEQPIGTELHLPGGVRWRREAGRVICRSTESSGSGEHPVLELEAESTLAPARSSAVY